MRAVLALLLVVPLVVAGCVQPSSSVDTASLPLDVPEGLEVISSLTSIIDVGGGMGEPSLGVTPDGVLFANGRDRPGVGFDSGAVFRSSDGGATWEKVGAPTAPMPNLDPDLAVDADGTVWFDTLWVGCTSTAVSRDEGETWNFNPAACVPPAGDRQYVIPTKGGTAYAYSHSLPSFQQVAVKTTDYGMTWLPTGPVELPDHHLLVNEGSGWGGGGFWNPVTDSVFFTWTWFEGGLTERAWSPAFAVTRDGGLTWSLGNLPNAGGRAHGLSLVVGAADAAGNVYLAWSETTGDDSGVYFASSSDDGRMWSAAHRVDVGEASNVFPAITAGPAGSVAIAYYESSEVGYPSDVSDDATWNVTLAWTDDALAAEPVFAQGQLSQHIVKNGPICPDGAGCAGNRQLLDYFSLKRMPDGRVAGLWTSTEDLEGKTVNVFGISAKALLA